MRIWSLVVVGTLSLLAAACEKVAPPQPASLEEGNRCFEAGQWSCAGANYNGYLKTYPDDPIVNARLAMARTRAGHHKEAIYYYQKAESLGVVTYDLFASYALSLDATGDLDGAIRANLKALEIVPRLVDVRGSLANQLVRKGQTQDAIELLEEFDAFLKRQGEDPYFTAQIASIKEKAGQKPAESYSRPVNKGGPADRVG
ncbi:MAG TPA: tetratricopeptide repeat protein [Caulobacter sp.]|nr:tetratricopeptide repeat protein [Caulobacter sp.]